MIIRPMKVLWLSNMLLPDIAKALGRPIQHRGGWMPALANALVQDGKIELGIVTNTTNITWQHQTINGIHYYLTPLPQGKFSYKKLPLPLIQGYQRAVEHFNPDIIHVHGTEYFQGLLTGCGHLQKPSVISIQGILDVYKEYYTAGIPKLKLLTGRSAMDWLRLNGLYEQQRRMYKRAKYERKIFKKNSVFIGRTTWDRAHTRRLNPSAQYYHCNELLRPVFFNTDWKFDRIKKFTIFASSAAYPLKGFHVLLKAVALLKHDYPDITIRSPMLNISPKLTGIGHFFKKLTASGYSNYLTNLIKRHNLNKHIISLGMLDAKNMAREYETAHVFVLPSYIENSPNSLAEAMLIGTPSVVSFVGGVHSMIQDNKTALGFPPGEEAVLAEQIRNIFQDDNLAKSLSVESKINANERYSKKNIVETMVNIYKEVASYP